MTRRTIYRNTVLIVTLRDDLTFLSAATRCGDGVTDLLTDEQKPELAEQVKLEIEAEA